MQTRIYLITHSDGCWLKAEYTVDHAEATRLARADYGDDVCVEPVPDTDAAAIKLARSKASTNRDPNAGKYQRHYAAEFQTAGRVLARFGQKSGQLVWGKNDYEAFLYTEMGVRLVFYPHRTSAGNYHIRVRSQGSKQPKRATTLMSLLYIGAGNNCTFQWAGHDLNAAHKLAEQQQLEYGWAEKEPS
ncbi:hypothetical protein [Cupriavidus pauculus]